MEKADAVRHPPTQAIGEVPQKWPKSVRRAEPAES